MLKQINLLTKPVTLSINLINNYTSRNILRNRYCRRRKDGTRFEYNESITYIPPEFADQDEYLGEKAVTKKYEERYEKIKQRFESSAGVQLPKKEATTNWDNFIKNSADDLPVSDLEDPYTTPMKQCIFCKYNIPLDYKNVQLLTQFISPITGFLYRQEITGLCFPKYKELEATLQKARKANLMPYRYKIETFISDPIIVDGKRDMLKDIPYNFIDDAQNNNK